MRAMNDRLATNIRTFRKSKGLTQEQLAEVFDVTVGAVHKWEAGLSTPELGMIMEIILNVLMALGALQRKPRRHSRSTLTVLR